MNYETTTNEDQLYRIGTVASLTGLSVERLRAWERRYNLSPAHKSGRTRFYNKTQLDRFKLIKRLIDLGHPISSLVELEIDQLEARLEHQADVSRDNWQSTIHSQPSVGLIGPNLLLLEQKAIAARTNESDKLVEINARWANIEAFETEQYQTEELDIIVVQLPVLNTQPIELVKNYFPNAEIIVLYQFTTSDIISEIQDMKIPTIKWPISWSEIEHMCLNGHQVLRSSRHPSPRKYSDEELIAIATSSEDPSSCPEYLVESIHQLNALSAYSSKCSKEFEHASSLEAVNISTTHARAELEFALERLISPKSPKKPKKVENS